MKTKIVTSTIGILALSSIALAIPVLAQTASETGLTATTSTTRTYKRGMMGSTSAQARSASTTAARMANMQSKSGKEIDQRIDSLNKLLTRVQSFNKVSDADKASIASSIQNVITTLTSLKTKIATDTSTSTISVDMKSITEANRVYALVIPKINVMAAADRVGTIYDMLSIIAGKIQVRLSQSTSTPDASSLQSDLSDMNAKLADAKTQAQNAINAVASLQPDNGDKTVMQSNTTALKAGRTDIQNATKDLTAARKDAQTIIQALRKDDGSLMTAPSTSKRQ